MQNRSCFMRKQTCNGEYTKHCTQSRHQLKIAAPAEVSEKCSNFRIRQFKEKRPFNIGIFHYTSNCAYCQNSVCADIQTDRHTHETTTVTLSAHARRGLIIAEVNEAKLFAVISDELQDAASIEQITFVLRYVRKEGDSYVVKESFVGFKEQHCEITEEGIAGTILEKLEELGLICESTRARV